MFINYLSEYLPEPLIPNDYFFENCGITDAEIIAKSGIRYRRYTQPDENTNTMAIEAVKTAVDRLSYSIGEVDLIIGATYTPFDTVGTIAHAVQSYFKIDKTRCFNIDSACSSFINALEVAEAYFTIGKAHKALLVVSENNSLYSNPSDPQSGFLWGDGAAAVFLSKEKCSDDGFEVIDINTQGLGNIGKNVDGVYLRPSNGGLKMPFGKDVFQYACNVMAVETEQILRKNNLSISEIDYFIPHQANIRIMEYVAKKLNINPGCVLANIENYGNTGSASTPIVLAQNKNIFKPGDKIVIAVFGGGYSSGSVLLTKI